MNSHEQNIARMIKSKIYQKDPNAEVILFGSHAKGNSRSDSDWDILILLNNVQVNRKLEKEYREELFDIELEIGEPITTLVFSKSDWETRHIVTPLYENIKRDGIHLQ